MAHWAELDENNIVVRVLVGSNDDLDEGYQWLVDNLGGTWVKTSYNTQGGVHLLGGNPFRKNFAGLGYRYDSDLDAFIPPKTFNSWILNEDTCIWEAPVSRPSDNNIYAWNEELLSWEINN